MPPPRTPPAVRIRRSSRRTLEQTTCAQIEMLCGWHARGKSNNCLFPFAQMILHAPGDDCLLAVLQAGCASIEVPQGCCRVTVCPCDIS